MFEKYSYTGTAPVTHFYGSYRGVTKFVKLAKAEDEAHFSSAERSLGSDI